MAICKAVFHIQNNPNYTKYYVIVIISITPSSVIMDNSQKYIMLLATASHKSVFNGVVEQVAEQKVSIRNRIEHIATRLKYLAL